MTSVFSSYQNKAWPHRFAVSLTVFTIAGGTPSDDKVAEGWLKTKLADKDDLIREAVAKTMVERGITAEAATAEVDSLKHLNGFKRDNEGLYIEGRQAKAMLKEAVSVAVASGKLTLRGWGETRKFITSYFPEHVFVMEDRLHLGVTEPTGVMQRFVHTFRGTGIQYEEFVEDAKLSFTVVSDHDFSEEEWAMVWLTGEKQGVGASRSQVTSWERLKSPARVAASPARKRRPALAQIGEHMPGRDTAGSIR
jgi:hypothetical protein